jgi:hypothetical protein
MLDDAVHMPSSQAATKTSVGALDGGVKSGAQSGAFATAADRNAPASPRGD